MDGLTITYLVMFFFGIYFLFLFLILYRRNKKSLYDFPEAKLFQKVSFIVPAYNEEESIEETLKALLEIEYPKGKKEIIVVNDGSKDRTREIVERIMKEHKEIKLLNKENSGKADSINQGLKIASGELIAITDADSYPQKDALLRMIGYFEEDEKVAAVTSRVLVKNKGGFIEKFQGLDYAIIAWSRKILDYIDSVYVTNGPLSIYRKRILDQIGGFDIKNMTEDIELTWHLLSLGYKTKMSYSAIVYTTVPSTIKKWINQRVRWNLGGIQTINKYKKNIARGTNLFGFFIIPYVTLSFILAIVGIILLARFLWIKGAFYIFSIPLFFSGYNLSYFLHFNFLVTFLFILGFIFMILSLIYYLSAVSGTEFKKKSIKNIFVYIFLYRPLYVIPLILALYKFIRRDIRWYTK